jgi:ketosteroid isomerase-like protein
MNNIDTVREIYEAFGTGDIPAILDKLDDNVEWDTDFADPAAPWLTPRRGRDNVAGFFESLAPLSFTKFAPHTIAGDGNKVFR